MKTEKITNYKDSTNAQGQVVVNDALKKELKNKLDNN